VSDEEGAPAATPGTLYVVATPIGNLEDVTLRALAVLRSVEIVACEDTRRTRVLLDRHGIEARLVPFHKFNEARAAATLVRRLAAGESVALVSDGGTPAISDPGYRLVRAALDAKVAVAPVPGPSAFVAAVSASGLPSEAVTFRGFLPHRAGERRRAITALAAEAPTQVFYESPHRIAAALQDLASILGPRPAAVVREMTKRFESWYRGSLVEIAERIAGETARGEYCIVVEGARALRPGRSAAARARRAGGLPALEAALGGGTGAGPEAHVAPGTALPPAGSSAGPTQAETLAALQRAYEKALRSGIERKEALKLAARECGITRKDAYRLLMTE
jgi:16S rRNA (cytidine1402-2'-O)-methyltransferase